MSKTMILKPRISEKAYQQSEAKNVYVFQVPNDANKVTVATAIQEQFSVTVTDVNILNVKGKAMRSYRKGGRPSAGTRSDKKKAYVTLAEGDSIAVFATEDEQEAPKAEKKGKK